MALAEGREPLAVLPEALRCLTPVYEVITTLRAQRGRNKPDLLTQSFRNTAWPYRCPSEFASMERVMIREDVQGSTRAIVVAVLAVTCAIGVLYLPLILG